jgi:hypothetical protein
MSAPRDEIVVGSGTFAPDRPGTLPISELGNLVVA